MIELPESVNLARELKEALKGKKIEKVLPPSSVHKFCWYEGEPEAYDALLKGKKIVSVESYGIYVEIIFDQETKLNFNDGVNIRLLTEEENLPVKYQLAVFLDSGEKLVFTVAMYGGIIAYQGENTNEYYQKNKIGVSAISKEFTNEYWINLIHSVKPTMSLKAFLATEQRIIGIGNGVLQDILFAAKLHPKRKIESLSEEEKDILYQKTKSVLEEMIRKGGRDTEKDMYGNLGNYKTILSKNTYKEGCPVCHGAITKENYLGGSIYYCPNCQPMKK
jgi:hypothetical protein